MGAFVLFATSLPYTYPSFSFFKSTQPCKQTSTMIRAWNQPKLTLWLNLYRAIIQAMKRSFGINGLIASTQVMK